MNETQTKKKKNIFGILKIIFYVIVIAFVLVVTYIEFNLLQNIEKNTYATTQVAVYDSNIKNVSDTRTCQSTAFQYVQATIEQLKKTEKKLTKEEQNKLSNEAYLNCMYLKGRYNPKQENNQKNNTNSKNNTKQNKNTNQQKK